MNSLHSLPYQNFRAWVPRKRLTVLPHSPHDYIYYDWGPRSYPEPLICLHDILGSAEVFHRQIIALAPRGYRIVSITIPTCNNLSEFITVFLAFLDALSIKKYHLYGAGLGGFLALAIAAHSPDLVGSIVLTHAWLSTTSIRDRIKQRPSVIRWMPDFLLRGIIKELGPKGKAERQIAETAHFVMKDTLGNQTRESLKTRLLLSTSFANVMGKVNIPHERITILDTLDRTDPLAPMLARELAAEFPQARRALLKTGGDFPYLSRAEEVNVHLVVHLRRHAPTPTKTVPLPPPVYVAPPKILGDRKKKQSEEDSKDGSKPDIESLATAMAEEARTKRLQVYSKEIQEMKEVFPEASGDQIAAVLHDNEGNVEVATRRWRDGEYPDNFKDTMFDAAIQRARLTLSRKLETENAAASNAKRKRGAKAGAANDPSNDATANDVNSPGRAGTKSSPGDAAAQNTAVARKKNIKKEVNAKNQDEQVDQVSAYLTTGKASPRKTPLIGRGPAPFPEGARRTPEKPSRSTSFSSIIDRSDVEVHQPSFATEGEPTSAHRGTRENRQQLSDEWSDFRLDKDSRQPNSRTETDSKEKVEEDERLREWTTHASAATERK